MSKSIDKVIQKIQQYMSDERLIWQNPCITMTQANYKTKHEYQGINRFITALVTHFEGYQSPYWLTFKQVCDFGGELKNAKGKGVPILFYKQLCGEDEDESNGVDDKENKHRFVISHSNVFNCDLVEGIDMTPATATEVEITEPELATEKSDRTISDYLTRTGIPVLEGSPCYRPKSDEIRIPARTRFISPGEFYSTYFHELAHSTGHESRLARFKSNAGTFTRELEYSKEEMIAEYTSALLCQECGVNNESVIKNQAAYIQGWHNFILNAGQDFVSAVSRAYQARDFLFGTV